MIKSEMEEIQSTRSFFVFQKWQKMQTSMVCFRNAYITFNEAIMSFLPSFFTRSYLGVYLNTKTEGFSVM